jgi:hypothetical protein
MVDNRLSVQVFIASESKGLAYLYCKIAQQRWITPSTCSGTHICLVQPPGSICLSSSLSVGVLVR